MPLTRCGLAAEMWPVQSVQCALSAVCRCQAQELRWHAGNVANSHPTARTANVIAPHNLNSIRLKKNISWTEWTNRHFLLTVFVDFCAKNLYLVFSQRNILCEEHTIRTTRWHDVFYVFCIAGHRHRGRCPRYRYSGIQHLSLVS